MPVLLYVFRFLLIYVGELIARPRVGMQEFIELGLYGLSVAVLSALNEESHEPGRQRCDCVPVEGFALEQKPGPRINADH
jgi:hypothetical protein